MDLYSGQMFIHYCETAPTARGQHIYTHVLSRIAAEFSGDYQILISTSAHNIASIKGITKAGYEEITRKRLMGLLGFKICQTLKKKQRRNRSTDV